MASVNVRLPTGHRQNVKVTPNTAIIQILDEVCEKWKLDPESYDLRFHNKVLDTSAMFRFSGVPNNASLEMTTCTKPRVMSDVTVRLQIEGQEPKVGVFTPISTLMDILKVLVPELTDNLDKIILLYAQKTFSGEQDFQSTTMRKLGLFKGQVTFRLRVCDPEQLNQQAHVYKPMSRVHIDEQLDPETPGPSQNDHKTLRSDSVTIPKPEEEQNNEKATEIDKEKEVTKEEKPSSSQDSKFSSANSKFATKTFDPINLIRREKKIKIEKNDDERERDDEEKEKDDLEINQQEMEVSQEEKEETKIGNELVNEPKLKEPEISPMEVENKILTKIYVGERNALVYNKAEIKAVVREDAPDSFFNTTFDDVRKIYNQQRKLVESSGTAPLMTASMRQQENHVATCTLLNTYPKSVIRICFPNQMVLQGVFRSVESVQAIYDFVRSHLKHSDDEFQLYEAPPRRNLDPKQRLFEENLIPLANVYYSGSSELKEEVQSQLSDYEAAEIEALALRDKTKRSIPMNSELPKDPNEFTEPMSGPSGTWQINSEPSTSQQRTETACPKPKKSEGKVPNWFAKGLKKF